jgi:hypothetical protein
MCELCEGASWDEVIADARRKIAGTGYTLFGVATETPESSPWVYTAGLVDAADHPELIIAGVAVETSAEILTELAGAVIDGERLEVGQHRHVSGERVRIGAVDDVQQDLDTFAMWHRLRDRGVLHAARLSAVQIVLEHAFCAEHEHAQPALADPAARVGVRMRENRAARRRRARTRRDPRRRP